MAKVFSVDHYKDLYFEDQEISLEQGIDIWDAMLEAEKGQLITTEEKIILCLCDNH